jgi:hypothetical protein
MSIAALTILTLMTSLVFLRGLWCLRRLHRLKTNGVCATGRVVECDNGSQCCTATIQYLASGSVWTIYDRAEPGEYHLGQEIAVRCLPDAPSQGEVVDFRAWYDAWATVVLSVVGEAFFISWPWFFGE